MARLTSLGEFEGPGEKKTAQYLAQNLPDHWHVIHGRQLPNRTRTEIDFLIVADNHLFVVEEKSWGPEIAIEDVDWYVIKGSKLDRRSSPAYQASQAAKKVAGWLKERRLNLEFMTCISVVIMSYDDVVLRVNPNQGVDDSVLKLQGCEEFFTRVDKRSNPKFRASKESVDNIVSGLSGKSSDLSQIGDYAIVYEVPEPFSGVRTFFGEHINSGEEALLTCFDHSYWNSDDNQKADFIKRERNAYRALQELGSAWVVLPDFVYERKQWWVVPSLKPHRFVPLSSMSSEDTIQDFKLSAERMFLNALETLSAIHSEGVVHKNITPESVWIGPKNRIKFSSFRLAHIDGHATLRANSNAKERNPFLAPEVQDPDFYSSYEADAYSLASSFSFCLFGSVEVPDEADGVSDKLIEILGRMLHHTPDSRISLKDAIEKLNLTEVSKREGANPLEVSDEFIQGGLISKRYKLLQSLGEGGMGVSWLAQDTFDGGKLRVVKALRRTEDYELAIKEYGATSALKGINFCSTPRASNDLPAPGYLVYDFVPGSTLETYSDSDEFKIDKAKSLFIDSLRRIGQVHEKGMVHGDLSPRNILIDEQENLWLIDFGLAVEIGKKQFGGTPSTMSPEASKKKELFPYSDLYSLCASFVFSILGRAPYTGQKQNLSARDWNIRYLTDAERQQVGDEGASFLTVLLNNCDEDPSKRAQSAEELFEQVDAIRRPQVNEWPEQDAEQLVNSSVNKLRKLYIQSKSGASNSMGKDDTYAQTLLDTKLIPDVLSGKARLVFLTGNAGDGKTSFLQTLQAELKSQGFKELEADRYGWTYEQASLTVRAINDASESRNGLSRDERTKQLLDSYVTDGHTVLLAINDGRMREFFEDYSLEYPIIAQVIQDYFEQGDSQSGDVVVVDLKTRSLVSGTDVPILDSVIEQVTSPQLWDECHGCTSAHKCPIFQNSKALAGSARESVKELFEITHLRRKKRITLRQMRSTLSWLITGDLQCEDVHEMLDRPTHSLQDWDISQLAFSDATTDLLIQTWKDIDPAGLNSSKMSKLLEDPEIRNLGFSANEIYRRGMRMSFFRQALVDNSEVSQNLLDDSRSYKYLSRFVESMKEPAAGVVPIILRGMSRLVGSIFYEESDLVISKRTDGNWIPLRKFPMGEFKLDVLHPTNEYIETQFEALFLTHVPSSNRFLISLDIFEVLCRSEGGQLMNDPASDAVRHEVQRFTNSLIGQPINEIYIVEPSGKQNLVRVSDGLIHLGVEVEGING
jgi:serine/threonine protein kinase